MFGTRLMTMGRYGVLLKQNQALGFGGMPFMKQQWQRLGMHNGGNMLEAEKKWIETNNSVCALLRQAHDVLALSSLPPKRKWVGLTFQEQQEAMLNTHSTHEALMKAEEKLKEKNNA
jgi:hypothetical protein